MKELIKNEDLSFDSYISDNRTKLDESLISLRLMKVLDDFLIENSITHRDFAKNINCSESYISQLMSGTKKFNVSFLNKFEKAFKLKMNFKIESRNKMALVSEGNQLFFVGLSSDSSVVVGTDTVDLIMSDGTYTVDTKDNASLEIS
ncbi:helix-turn-helix transcriptional regulator [Marivirga sp.]|uniref:helix-turn-helix domain-containing protein n=1 Tax=Marivirga sp. TaxID=2018662 RepID=UPI0025CBF659|nr:helix-turn-helix transcriptional regulator [Marivirga sp.]